MNTYLILVGGLGNQMFMFASALALTRSWGYDLNLISYWYYGKQRGEKFKLFERNFELIKFNKLNKYIIPKEKKIQKIVYVISRILNKLKINKNHFFLMYAGRVFNKNLFNKKTNILMGYYQSFKYFQHIRSEIIEIFTLSDEVEASIKSRIAAFNIHLQRVLMIHIRREDTLVEGNDWTGLLSIDYYKKAMEKIDAKNKCVLVFSDDITWCKKQSLFENCNFIDEPDPVITVRMMQYCDDFIIAGSTLSWWGAWLSQSNSKRIIAPFPFYKKVNEQYDADLIPDDWETLNSEFSDIEIT